MTTKNTRKKEDPKKKIFVPDKNDIKILEQLYIDEHMSFAQIAENTNMGVDAVKYRIKKWQENEILTFQVMIYPDRLGYTISKDIYLHLLNYKPKDIEELIAYTKGKKKYMRNIIYSAKMTGKYDFVITIVAKTIDEFDEVFQDFRKKFKHIITDFDLGETTDEYEYDYMLKLLK